jgi:hypothetical protein
LSPSGGERASERGERERGNMKGGDKRGRTREKVIYTNFSWGDREATVKFNSKQIYHSRVETCGDRTWVWLIREGGYL